MLRGGTLGRSRGERNKIDNIDLCTFLRTCVSQTFWTDARVPGPRRNLTSYIFRTGGHPVEQPDAYDTPVINETKTAIFQDIFIIKINSNFQVEVVPGKECVYYCPEDGVFYPTVCEGSAHRVYCRIPKIVRAPKQSKAPPPPPPPPPPCPSPPPPPGPSPV